MFGSQRDTSAVLIVLWAAN